MKRLASAIVDGFGWAAGKTLFDEAVEGLSGETPEARAKREEESALEEKRRAKAGAQEEKKRAAEEKRQAKERATAKKKADAEIDRELAALKRRLGK